MEDYSSSRQALRQAHRLSRRLLAVPFILALSGLLTAGYLSTFTPARVVDGSRVIQVRTHQSTVEGALREVGLQLQPEDVVIPSLQAPVPRNGIIEVRRARLVKVSVDGNEPRLVRTQRQKAYELLADLGYTLTVNDALKVNGRYDENLPLLARGNGQIDAEVELRRGVPVTIREVGGATIPLKTTARTVGEALLQAGYVIYLADAVQPAPGSVIRPGMEIVVERAKPVTIWVDGRPIRTRTLRGTVGEVLADMNVVLLGEDYTRPELSAPALPNTEIRVVRVQRELQIRQDPIPFEKLWQPDPELELDTQVLSQEGAPGVREQRRLVTYEDGVEVKRELLADFVARQPQPRINKYGTKIVLRTLDTPSGPIQYWRRIRMLATSYSASTAGVPRSSPWYGRTRCGIPMRFGIVAVDPGIIPLNTNVYVPGYGQGLACDTGGAIRGKRIDLGYDDTNLRMWYSWVDVYLLPPVPANIRYRID
ncbi:MAG: ubiquitin-like domain-containing protein [Anaerolineae bacterium]|nr:ubiquitin-like domain-containing protein [Anaerolineae bacterium]